MLGRYNIHVSRIAIQAAYLRSLAAASEGNASTTRMCWLDVASAALSRMRCALVYRSCLKSFGAAHWLAQCIMWKTEYMLA